MDSARAPRKPATSERCCEQREGQLPGKALAERYIARGNDRSSLPTEILVDEEASSIERELPLVTLYLPPRAVLAGALVG